jgi:hypothetical protein
MRVFYVFLFLCFASFLQSNAQSGKKKIKLFDGRTFKGWEGDTVRTWLIKTTGTFSNYHLRLKFKLTGTEGFINGGVQFHSQRIAKPDFEMVGYQADIGDGFWASLYDESRRDKLLAIADPEKVKKLLRRNEWNNYEVRSEGRRIQIFLNGEQTVDYTEPDPAIPQSGHIAFQLHGGGKTEVFYKDIILEKLP